MRSTNSSSSECGFPGELDRKLSEKCISSLNIGEIFLLRTTLERNLKTNSAGLSLINMQFEANNLPELALTEDILDPEYPEKDLKGYAQQLLNYKKLLDTKDSNSLVSSKASMALKEDVEMYRHFKDTFQEYGYAVVEQVVQAIIKTINDFQYEVNEETGEEVRVYNSHMEVLENYDIDTEIIPAAQEWLEEMVNSKYANYDENTADAITKQQFKIANKVFEPNSMNWASIIFMAKGMLLDSEKIRIGSTMQFVQDMEEELSDLNEDGENVQKTESAEEQGPEHWMRKADTLSSFLGLTREVRSVLYRLSNSSSYDSGNIDDKGILGVRIGEDVYKTHQELLDLVYNNGIQNSDEFIDNLERSENSKPWMIELAAILKEDPILKTQFFVCYKRNRLNYVDHSKFKGRTQRNLSMERAKARVKKVVTELTDIKSDSCIFQPNGAVNAKKLANFRLFIEKYLSKIVTEEDGSTVVDVEIMEGNSEEEKRGNFISRIEDYFNLTISSADKMNLKENTVQFNSFAIRFTEFISKNFSKLSAPGASLKSLTSGNNEFSYYFNRFLVPATQYTTEYGASHPVEKCTRYNGSTYMAYTVPSHLGDTIDKIRNAGNRGARELREYIENEYLSNPLFAEPKASGNGYVIFNPWLEKLYNTTERDLENPNSFYNQFVHSLARSLGNEQKAWENFTKGEMLAFYLNDFASVYNSSDKKHGTFPLFVTGDSGSTRSFTLPCESSYTSDSAGKQAIKRIVVSEIVRMCNIEELVSLLKDSNYSTDNFGIKEEDHTSFTLFPYLNGLLPASVITEAKEVYKRNRNIAEVLAFLEGNEDFKVAFEGKTESDGTRRKGALELAKEEFKRDLEDAGIISKDLLIFDSDKVNIPFNINEEFKDNNSQTPDSAFFNLVFYNTTVQTASQLQFLTADPVFYGSTEDLQKRYKEMIASGNVFDITATSSFGEDKGQKVFNTPYQRGKYFQDIVMKVSDLDSEFYKMISQNEEVKGKIGPYDDGSSLTDGQSFRSFSSYRSLEIASGKWTNAHERVYQIIMNHRKADRKAGTTTPLTEDEYKDILRQGVVFQPKKLFYFHYESITDTNGKTHLIPVQHKYSEVPLIPELLPDSAVQLKALGQYMNKEGLDFLMATSCVKVGCFGQASDISSCTTVEEFENAFSASSTHTLHLEGLREQSNVPEHNDTARGRGTQVTKHMLMNLGEIGTVDADKIPFCKAFMDKGIRSIRLSKKDRVKLNNITGKDLMNLCNALGASGFIRSMQSIMGQLRTNSQFSKVMYNLKKADTRSPLDNLEALAINESTGGFNMPLSELTQEFDNLAALLSKFRKEVIKQRFQGGSFVQMSALGFQKDLKVELIEDENRKKRGYRVDCAIPFDLSYTGLNGEKVSLDYFEYIDYKTGLPLGINGEKLKEEDIKEDWSNTKLGKDFPGIQEMIAYRIPTEKAYSIIHTRVKRFFPKTMGGVIMLPLQYTTIAGFDFDIDKLYIMRKEFVLNSKSAEKYKDSKEAKKIWDHFYKHNPIGKKIFKYLQDARKAHKQSLKMAEIDVNGATLESYIEELKETDPDFVTRLKEYNENPELRQRGLQSLLKNVFTAAQKEEYYRRVKKAKEEQGLGEYKKYLYQHWDAALDAMYDEYLEDPEKFNIPEGMTFEEYFPSTASKAFVEEAFLFDGTLEWESEYNPNKTVLENSQSAVNNLFLEFMKYQLSTEEVFAEKFAPGGYYTIKDARKEMLMLDYGDEDILKEILESNDPSSALKAKSKSIKKSDIIKRSPTSLSTIVHYQAANALSDKLIGIGATYSINQRLTALINTYTLNVPIKFGSILELNDPKAGLDIAARRIGDRDTEALVTEFLAAAVDAVKDSALEYFGLDLSTFNMACLLAKVGATAKDIGLLFKQPVVQLACKIANEGLGTSFSDALKDAFEILAGSTKKFNINNKNFKKDLDAAIAPPTRNEKGEIVEDVTKRTNKRNEYLTQDRLIESIIKYKLDKDALKNNNEFLKSQYAVIHLLGQVQEEASKFSDQCAGSHATSLGSVRTSAGGIMAFLQQIEQTYLDQINPSYSYTLQINQNQNYTINPYAIIGKDLEYFMSKYIIGNPYGMEQAAFSAIRTFFMRVLGRQFPYMTEGYMSITNALASITHKGYLTEEILNQAYKFIPQFFMARMINRFNPNNKNLIFLKWDGSSYDPHNALQSGSERMPNIVSYLYFFPHYIKGMMAQAKQIIEENEGKGMDVSLYKEFLNNPFIQAIDITASKDNDNLLYMTIPDIGAMPKDSKSILREGWERLAKSDNAVLRVIAQQLIEYSYFRGGQTFSPLSFSSVESTGLKGMISGYREFFERIRHLKEEDGTIVEKGIEGNYFENPKMKDVLKSFLLHNCIKYYQFRKIITPFNDNGGPNEKYDNITKQLEKTPHEFVVDPSDENSPLRSFVSEIEEKESPDKSEGEVNPSKYRYCPCIVIQDKVDGQTVNRVFICDNNKDSGDFFVSDEMMHYYEMELPVSSFDYSTPVQVGNTSEIQSDVIKTIVKSLKNDFKSNADTNSDQTEMFPKDNGFSDKNTEEPIKTGKLENELGYLGSDLSLLQDILDSLSIEDNAVIQNLQNKLTDFLTKFEQEDLNSLDFSTINNMWISLRGEFFSLENRVDDLADLLNNITERLTQITATIGNLGNVERLLDSSPLIAPLLKAFNQIIAFSKSHITKYQVDGKYPYCSASGLSQRRKDRLTKTEKQIQEYKKTAEYKARFKESINTVLGNYVDAMLRDLSKGIDIVQHPNPKYAHTNRLFRTKIKSIFNELKKALDAEFGEDYIILSDKFFLTGFLHLGGTTLNGSLNDGIFRGEPDLVVLGKAKGQDKPKAYIIDIKTTSTVHPDMNWYAEQQLALRTMAEKSIPALEGRVEALIFSIRLNLKNAQNSDYTFTKSLSLGGVEEEVTMATNRNDGKDITEVIKGDIAWSEESLTKHLKDTTLEGMSEKFKPYLDRVKRDWESKSDGNTDNVSITAYREYQMDAEQAIEQSEEEYNEKNESPVCGE